MDLVVRVADDADGTTVPESKADEALREGELVFVVTEYAESATEPAAE